MSRKFKSLLNLTTLPSDPSGSEGDVFFNTTEKALKIHNGEIWITLVRNTDPWPFYMHTHDYDGEVNQVTVPAYDYANDPANVLQADGGNVNGNQTHPPAIDGGII